MHYVIETKEQLSYLQDRNYKECFIEVIPNHDLYHPSLQDLSLIYLRPVGHSHGFILVINHNEGFSLHKHSVKSIINNIDTLYTLNKKNLMYFFDNKKIYDLNFINFINKENIVYHEDFNLPIHNNFYSRYYFLNNVNCIIPISKHYEKYEKIYEKIKTLCNQNDNKHSEYIFYNFQLTETFFNIEKQGLVLDLDLFTDFFDIDTPEYFIKENKIYSQYNLYNTTLRPSNSFNNINFAALNKDTGERKSFIPQNDYFVELDYRSFHLYILCKLIDYQPKETDLHTELGKIYFNKSELTPEEYKEAKQKTFHILYTDEIKKYNHIEFFAKVEEFKNNKWKSYKKDGKLLGFPTIFTKINSPTQILPYLLQNYETHFNTKIIKNIQEYLKNKHTKLILYLYDAFIFDFSKEDGKETLTDIINMIESSGFRCGAKRGENLHSLQSF